MIFRLTADLVVAVHVAFLVFAAVGALLARRWPRLALLHLPSLVWAAASITVGLTCPLTTLEKSFRELGGEQPYRAGFVDHYLEGVVFPESLTPVLQTAAAAAVVAGYAGLVRRRPTSVVS